MKRILLAILVLALMASVTMAGSTVLGTAQSFAVLGYAGVTNAHSAPNPQTTIWGNVGVDPLPLASITGFPPGIVTGGTIYGPGGVSLDARNDVTTAYGILKGLSGTDLTGQNLGGRTITPGVYTMTDSVALLNGALTLDAQGLPNARFVFNLAAALTTGTNAVVNVIGGDPGTEVYWVIGSTATLGDDTVFAGNILAYASVILDPRAAILCGRAFALNESVTLIDNKISNDNTAENFGSGRSDFGSYGFSGGGAPVIPVPGAIVLGSIGVAFVGWLRRRRTL